MKPTLTLMALLLAALAALAAVPGASAAPNTAPCNVGPFVDVQNAPAGFVYAFACVGSEFDRVCVYYILLDSTQARQCVPVPNP